MEKVKKKRESQRKEFIKQKYKINNFNSEWMTRVEASIYMSCSLSWLDLKCPVNKYYLGTRNPRYLKKDLDSYLLSRRKELIHGGKK